MTQDKFNAVLTVSILFLFFCIPVGEAQEVKQDKYHLFLWKVDSENSTAYILGSIHLANEGLYPLSPTIENAFEEASTLVVEVNPLTLDENRMQEQMLEKGVYSGEETIKDHVDGDLYELLENYLLKNGIPIEIFTKMRPITLALTLSALQLVKKGYQPEYGIDIYFSKKATNQKEIIELESLENQLSVLFEMPNESLFLRYTLLELQMLDELFNQILVSWKEGDHNGLYELILDPYEMESELQPILEKLYFERNLQMAKKIEELLKTSKTYFIVVGAGHLVGERGIISLLKRGQYEVVQL